MVYTSLTEFWTIRKQEYAVCHLLLFFFVFFNPLTHPADTEQKHLRKQQWKKNTKHQTNKGFLLHSVISDQLVWHVSALILRKMVSAHLRA